MRFAENMGPEQVCEAFNKIDPNLQVEYTRYVNDDAGNTKLDMTLMSDDSIDVFLNMNDVLLMKRIENGYMYPDVYKRQVLYYPLLQRSLSCTVYSTCSLQVLEPMQWQSQ